MNVRWIAVWSHELRSEPRWSLGVAALILVTALVASAVPRVLERASDGALRDEVAAAPSIVRDLELDQVGRIAPSSDDPLGAVEAAGAALELRYSAPIPSLVSAGSVVVDTPLWHVIAGTTLDTVLTLRIQQGVESHLKLVAGRLPTGASRTINDPTPGASPDSQLVLFETALSAQTADKLAVKVGGRLILSPEPSDPLAAHRSVRLALDIVGTYEVTDPADPYWLDDADVAHSRIYPLLNLVEYVRADALVAPTAYPPLMAATEAARLPMTYRWRSYIAPSGIDSSQLNALADALRRARTAFPPADPTLGNVSALAGPKEISPASLQTGLLGLLAAHQARWQSGATILTILWTGAGLVILASLALVAELIAHRRRAALALARRRGASRGQVGGAIVAEAIVLVVPATAVGAGLAIVVIPAQELGPTLAVAGALALAAIGLVAATSIRDGAETAERRRAARRLGSGRLVAETLVVGLAVLGAVLLRHRGEGPAAATPIGAGPAPVGADPFLAAAPALVGLAVGIIAARLLPLLLGLIGAIAARRRGLVAALGLRRATRDRGVAAVLLVALTAAASGSFASVLIDQIDAGASSAAWQAVGADFQVTGSPDDLAAFQTKHLAGIAATASIALTDVAVSAGGDRTLISVDPTDAAAVGAGTPADPDWPSSMLGSSAGPIPAIVSSNATGAPRISVGDLFSIRIDGDLVQLQVAATRDGYPAIPAGQAFVVISETQLAALHPTDVPAPSAVLVRAPSLSLPALQAAVADRPALTVQDRANLEAGLRNAPAVTAVSLGVLTAAIAVLGYGLLTVVLAITLETADRRRETARLHVLGLSTRQATGLILVEFAPALIIGVVAGIGLGLGLIGFVGPGLGLPAVLGVVSLESAPPDIARLALLGTLTLALIAAATLLSTVFERQTQLATAARE